MALIPHQCAHYSDAGCGSGHGFPQDCGGCVDYVDGTPDEERTPCEVWTRVMGYHRPVSAFNAGKRAEHADRSYFVERPGDATSAYMRSNQDNEQ